MHAHSMEFNEEQKRYSGRKYPSSRAPPQSTGFFPKDNYWGLLSMNKCMYTYTQTDTDRQTDTDTHRQTHTQRYTHRDTHTYTETQTETQTHTQSLSPSKLSQSLKVCPLFSLVLTGDSPNDLKSLLSSIYYCFILDSINYFFCFSVCGIHVMFYTHRYL